MKTIFMGTPDFAARALEAIINKGHEVVAVYTQPDKPKGRSKKLVPSEVKVMAEKYDIPVFQPVKLREAENVEKIKELDPEIIVVAAYGQILPLSILEIPEYGCVNIHASLLPKYRGAAPIERCIIDGEEKTGVTTMYMAEGLDTGDMLIKASTEIGKDETAGELHDRLALMGADVLKETLQHLEDGTLKPEKQDDSLSCYAPKLTKDMCPVDFNMTAQQVHDRIRGLSPWPCAVTEIAGKRLKIYKSTLKGKKYDLPAGTIADKNDLTIVCGDGYSVTFTEVQADGGKRMKTADYLRGNRI